MDITWDDQLSAPQQISQKKLINILDSINGKKDLIIESKLIKILDSFIGAKTLRQYGVEKIFKFEPNLRPANSQRVFITSYDLISCKRVLDQIQTESSQSPGLFHHLIVVPYILRALELLIEEEGLHGLVKLYPLTWEFVRLDGNVLSLELPLFNDLFYYKDSQLLPALARSLWTMTLILGSPKTFIAVGKRSQQVADLVQTGQVYANKSSQLGAMIVMDRTCDLASLLLTPVTYLGLMGEVIDIKAGVPILKQKQEAKLDPKEDLIYAEVRDSHFTDALPTFRAKAEALKSEEAVEKVKNVGDLKDFVRKMLPTHLARRAQLQFHMSVYETVIHTLSSEFEALNSVEKSALDNTGKKESLEYIEKNIDDHPLRSLRLLSLLSLTNDGLTSEEVQNIQKAYLHAHGFKNIPLFYKLTNIGLLSYKTDNVLQKLSTRNSKWLADAKRLKLLPKSAAPVDMQGPNCPSYVFNGSYIPTIAQLLNIVVSEKNNLTKNQDLLGFPDCIIKGEGTPLSPKTVLICVVGGVSYGEISACRFIEKSAGIRLVIASDSIVTGNKLIEEIQNI